MSSLIMELSTAEMQEYLSKLGLMVWFGELINSCKNTEATYSQKVEYKNGKESVAKRDAQIPVNEKLKELFSYIEFKVKYSNDPVWTQIYEKVNGVVNQVNIASRIRRGLQNNKSTDEESIE